MDEAFFFNPLDPETRRDPFALYARGRREHPVFVHQGLPRRLASVFRHADVQAILRDDQTWSNDFVLGLPREDQPQRSMLGTDGEEHRRLRGLVNKAFTPRVVQLREPRMREIANELVSAALEKGEVDLVEALSYPLPVQVIAEIIGIPPEDRAMFKIWSDEAVADLGVAFMSDPTPEHVQDRIRLTQEMNDYFIPLAEERRQHPREDLLTGLVMAEHEGSKLSADEMLSMLTLLLVAGNETTTTLIGNTALTLMEHPDELAKLRRNPALLESVIEEVLRFASPVQFDPRRATRDVTLHGIDIAEDEIVLAWIGSANRDETVFQRPDAFDVGRVNNVHLAFGMGAHYCLGANLARLETRVAIGTLLERTKQFERTDDDPLPLHPSPVFRAVSKIPLRLAAA